MASKKILQKVNEFSIYASYRDDKEYYEKQHIKRTFMALPHSLLMNKNFLALRYSSKIIYMYMTDYSKGNKSFKFPYSIYSKITTKATFETSKNELIKYGFIEEVANGKNTRTANIYEFSSRWKDI